MKLKAFQDSDILRTVLDKVEGDKIILDGQGHFPKILIIKESGKSSEYRLVKTKTGGYILNK